MVQENILGQKIKVRDHVVKTARVLKEFWALKKKKRKRSRCGGGGSATIYSSPGGNLIKAQSTRRRNDDATNTPNCQGLNKAGTIFLKRSCWAETHQQKHCWVLGLALGARERESEGKPDQLWRNTSVWTVNVPCTNMQMLGGGELEGLHNVSQRFHILIGLYEGGYGANHQILTSFISPGCSEEDINSQCLPWRIN